MAFPGQQQLQSLQQAQATCHKVTGDVLDDMSKLVEQALADLRRGNQNAAKELSSQLKSRKVVKKAANATRDFHSTIREFGGVCSPNDETFRGLYCFLATLCRSATGVETHSGFGSLVHLQ